MPAGFGALASVMTGLLGWEITRKCAPYSTVFNCFNCMHLYASVQLYQSQLYASVQLYRSQLYASVQLYRSQLYGVSRLGNHAQVRSVRFRLRCIQLHCTELMPRTSDHAVRRSPIRRPHRSTSTRRARRPNAAVAAVAIMAILPGHLMRSIAGGFDNESIAVSAMVFPPMWTRPQRRNRDVIMLTRWGYGADARRGWSCIHPSTFIHPPALHTSTLTSRAISFHFHPAHPDCERTTPRGSASPRDGLHPTAKNPFISPPAQITTFYLWVRSLRSDSSWPFAIACGVAYIYMAPTLSGLGAEPNQP